MQHMLSQKGDFNTLEDKKSLKKGTLVNNGSESCCISILRCVFLKTIDNQSF